MNINRQKVEPVKEKLLDQNSTLDTTLFDDVLRTVKQNLMDSMYRFVETNAYRTYIKMESISKQMLKDGGMS